MDLKIEAPGALAAKATGPGVNRIEFSGADADSEVVYEVWRRHGDTVDWYLHTTTSGRDFEDSDVKPGQYYEYKIRAVRGESVSDFSETAVVYGMA